MNRLDDLERRIEALERELHRDAGVGPVRQFPIPPLQFVPDCSCPKYSICGNTACPRAIRPYSSAGDVRA